jgi:pterin-4a-carbinolamine dehydratase
MFLIINRIPEGRPWYWHFHHPEHSLRWEWNDDEDSTSNTKTYSDQNLSVPFDSLSKRGILILDAAAGDFKIKGNTKEFLTFAKTGDIGNYEMTARDVSDGKQITLKMKEGTSRHNIRKNEVNIKLNTIPSWNLEMNIGAASADFDLTDYKIENANFEAGAASMDVKLGDKSPKTVLLFNAGASSIHVEVPKTSGCQVTSESFLVSKTLEGFENKGNHVYETSNFNSNKTKIYITIKTAVSSIEVTRY